MGNKNLENLTNSEIQLKEQLKVFETLFDATLDIMVYLDLDMRVLAYNKALIESFYIEKEKLIGFSLKNLFEVKTRGDFARINKIWPKMEKAILDTQETAKPSKIFEELYVDSGDSVFYNIIVAPVLDNDGNVQATIVTAREVTKEVELSKSLEERSNLLACILDNLPLYAFLKGKNGEFVMGSSAFQDAFKDKVDDVSKLTNNDVFTPAYRELVTAEEKELFKTKRTLDVERTIRFVNQDCFCRIHKAPLFDNNGDVKYLVVMCENIEQKREIEKQREYFVKTLIHDLKVPTLAQLRGMELLLKEILGPVNNDQRDLIDEISGSCKYVLDMISSVLDSYRLESGEKKLCFSHFKARDLLKDCLKSVQIQKNTFEYSISPSSLEIYGDKNALQCVLETLISTNTTSENNSAVFEISVKANKRETVVTITRPGIAAFVREERLISFSRLMHDAKFTTVGYGIGLFMCKKIIDLHHGSIFASSDGANINLITFTIPNK